MPDVPVAFFSYSREDSEFALRLASDLKAAGSSVWLDQLDIGPGQHWDRAVQSALENCPCMLLILSPASANSDNVMDEFNFALEQKKTVIPVLYRDCDIPFRIRRFQHLDFRNDYDRMLQELKKCLHIGSPPQAASAALAQTQPTGSPGHSETAKSGTPAQQAPPAPHAAPPPQFPPVQSTAPAQPVSVYSPANTASKFPVWAKITVGVVAALFVVGVLMNMGSNPSRQRGEQRQDYRDTNSTPSGALPTESGAARPGVAEKPGEPFELVGAVLTRNETESGCPPLGKNETNFTGNDISVWFVFAYQHGSADDHWLIDWIAPDGEIEKTEVVRHPAAGGGKYCYFMRISGYDRAPGNWGVRLTRNGVEMAQRAFRISR